MQILTFPHGSSPTLRDNSFVESVESVNKSKSPPTINGSVSNLEHKTRHTTCHSKKQVHLSHHFSFSSILN